MRYVHGTSDIVSSIRFIHLKVAFMLAWLNVLVQFLFLSFNSQVEIFPWMFGIPSGFILNMMKTELAPLSLFHSTLSSAIQNCRVSEIFQAQEEPEKFT